MKQTWLFKAMSHPVMQLISFSIIMIDGEIFAAPYLWYVRYASTDGQLFAIVGVIAMLVSLVSIFVRRYLLQLAGLALMWLSLLIFFFQAHNKAGMFQFPITELSLLLFLAVSVSVLIKYKPWKSY